MQFPHKCSRFQNADTSDSGGEEEEDSLGVDLSASLSASQGLEDPEVAMPAWQFDPQDPRFAGLRTLEAAAWRPSGKRRVPGGGDYDDEAGWWADFPNAPSTFPPRHLELDSTGEGGEPGLQSGERPLVCPG